MHTDYVGVRGYQDVGELPQRYNVAMDQAPKWDSLFHDDHDFGPDAGQHIVLLAHSDDSYPPVGELPSFPLGAPWRID